MGTVSTTPTINPPTFSGVSSYSSSFQQVLQRAVSIAALPLQQLQNGVSTMQGQQSALSGLQTTFGSLENAIQGLATAAQGSVGAAVSDPSIVSATASSNALPGTYTITVNNLGSSTTTLSLNGLPTVTDPTQQNISTASSFTLTINGTGHTITPSGTSLESLASAINNSGLAVTATIVNVGTNASPDYRLAVTSNNLAPDTIQLNAGATTLLGQVGNAGAPASYTVGGNTISANSTTVTLAPGLTVNLLEAAPNTPVTITVGQSYSGLDNALNNLATTYNAAVDAVNQQHGQNAGILLGDSVVFSLGQALQSLTGYSSPSGTVHSLADLGLTLDDAGHLNFDPSVLAGANTTDVTQFLGGLTSGGFLQSANSAITTMSDPTTGVIQGEIASIQKQITDDNSQIADQTDQINNMESSMEQQLSAADAAIAVLQQQVTLLSGMFAYQNSTSNNYNVAASNNPIP